MPNCTICHENLPAQEASVVKCGHPFHFECIFDWWKTSKTCPICRKKIKNFKNDVITRVYFDGSESEDDQGPIQKKVAGKATAKKGQAKKTTAVAKRKNPVRNAVIAKRRKTTTATTRNRRGPVSRQQTDDNSSSSSDSSDESDSESSDDDTESDSDDSNDDDSSDSSQSSESSEEDSDDSDQSDSSTTSSDDDVNDSREINDDINITYVIGGKFLASIERMNAYMKRALESRPGNHRSGNSTGTRVRSTRGTATAAGVQIRSRATVSQRGGGGRRRK